MADRRSPARRSFRGPATVVALAITALAVFAIFLAASFPYDQMASSILAPYRVKLTYRAQHLHLPIGVALDDVDLVSIASSPGQTLLQSPSLKLRPTLGALILGRPGLGVDMQVCDGALQAVFQKAAGAIGASFKADALNLSEAPLPPALGVRLGGKLSAAGTARIFGPLLAANQGQAKISGQTVTVEVTQGFPLIHLGTVTGLLSLDHGLLNFQDLESHGGDIESRADGAIQLADDPADSTIVARVYLTPTESGRAHFGLLLNMLPHPPSEGPYEVRGRLLAPTIS